MKNKFCEEKQTTETKLRGEARSARKSGPNKAFLRVCKGKQARIRKKTIKGCENFEKELQSKADEFNSNFDRFCIGQDKKWRL